MIIIRQWKIISIDNRHLNGTQQKEWQIIRALCSNAYCHRKMEQLHRMLRTNITAYIINGNKEQIEIERGRSEKKVPLYVILTVVLNSSFSFHTFTLCQLCFNGRRTKAHHSQMLPMWSVIKCFCQKQWDDTRKKWQHSLNSIHWWHVTGSNMSCSHYLQSLSLPALCIHHSLWHKITLFHRIALEHPHSSYHLLKWWFGFLHLEYKFHGILNENIHFRLIEIWCLVNYSKTIWFSFINYFHLVCNQESQRMRLLNCQSDIKLMIKHVVKISNIVD